VRAVGSTFQQAFSPCYRYVWKGVAELMGGSSSSQRVHGREAKLAGTCGGRGAAGH